MSAERKGDAFWLLFESTGQKFPIRFMNTSDQYEVELPCGVYTGVAINDLRREVRNDFNNVRITK